jgi:hypothetical protein
MSTYSDARSASQHGRCRRPSRSSSPDNCSRKRARRTPGRQSPFVAREEDTAASGRIPCDPFENTSDEEEDGAISNGLTYDELQQRVLALRRYYTKEVNILSNKSSSTSSSDHLIAEKEYFSCLANDLGNLLQDRRIRRNQLVPAAELQSIRDRMPCLYASFPVNIPRTVAQRLPRHGTPSRSTALSTLSSVRPHSGWSPPHHVTPSTSTVPSMSTVPASRSLQAPSFRVARASTPSECDTLEASYPADRPG